MSWEMEEESKLSVHEVNQALGFLPTLLSQEEQEHKGSSRGSQG